jgi:putative transposase
MRYGSRRIAVELRAQGIPMCRQQVGRIMKLFKLKAIQPRSFIPRTTDSRHTIKTAPNLLLTIPKAQKAGSVWVGDITYIPMTNQRWAYLATWLDQFTHQIVGWHVDIRMKDELVIRALMKGKRRFPTHKGMIVHSDRGRQYGSARFRKLLADHHWIPSMSRKGNVYDNATCESLFARLKCELIGRKVYESLEELHNELFEYIENYYNSKRRHSSLNYFTPNEIQNYA